MKKQEVLKQLHALLGGLDRIDQQDLWLAQQIITDELLVEANKGKITLEQYENGYIHTIDGLPVSCYRPYRKGSEE